MNICTTAATKVPDPKRAMLQRVLDADRRDLSIRARGWIVRAGEQAYSGGSGSVITVTLGVVAEPQKRSAERGRTTLDAMEATADARAVAHHVLAAFAKLGHQASRITRTAAGGVAFYLFGSDLLEDGSHRLYACVEADEDGEVTVLLKDRTGSSTVLGVPDDVSLADGVRRAIDFVEA